MKVHIDTDTNELVFEEGDSSRAVSLYSHEAFAWLARYYLKVGWHQKHSYGFSWMGRPIIQLPDDLVRIQEVIHRVAPDVLIETGVAHGGSLVFYASLFAAMGKGRVVGVDVRIRDENRAAIEAHPLASRISLVVGSSVDPETIARVRAHVGPEDRVLVILDSNHTKAHVAAELEAYADLVTPGSYIVATDGLMEDLHDVPRAKPSFATDNPAAAARELAQRRTDFVLEDPPAPFDETEGLVRVTYWPSAYLRKR